jgi:23S rRNA (pseudouridine1915-N3)-methyltransferase
MKIEIWCLGKTHISFVKDGINDFSKRLSHYCNFDIIEYENYKSGKSESSDSIKDKEAEIILKKLEEKDYLILLDEKGKEFDSIEFAAFVEKLPNFSSKKTVFLIGGAFGFSKKIYERANFQISLSKMTYSHQLIRLIFAEQLYRGFTIIKNEKYHNI